MGLACLALAAGLASWSYRYGATHHSTRFWGLEAALLIARPSEVEFFQLELAAAIEGSSEATSEGSSWHLDLGRPYLGSEIQELTNMRGMVHFRHALMTDGNYDWTSEPKPSEIDWRWGMRFYDGENQAIVVLAEDLATIGLVVEGGTPPVRALSCQPMAETLRAYFGTVDLAEAESEDLSEAEKKAASTQQ